MKPSWIAGLDLRCDCGSRLVSLDRGRKLFCSNCETGYLITKMPKEVKK
jgi:hypothetical protein